MRKFRFRLRPFVVKKTEEAEIQLYPLKYVYDAIAHLLTAFFFNYGMSSFVALSFERTMDIYANLYFSGHLLAGIGFIITFGFLMLPKGNKKKKD